MDHREPFLVNVTRAAEVRPLLPRALPMTAGFRTALPADIPDVLRLWREAAVEPTTTDDAGSLGRLLDHDPGALIVADDGVLVGSVMATFDGWRGSIYRLAVAPAHRRTGLGRRLLGAAEQRLAGLGATRLQAVVVDTDDRATGFWRGSGWEQQAGRLRFVADR
jgi:ribosomal protein S18 acetylase RimI-like enzyme